MPFCHLTIRAKKPKDSKYPTELRTLGDHLRKRRLDLELPQLALAQRLGVTACTVKNWELDHTSPTTRYLPAVIDFLGYQPNEPGRSFAETLRHHRRAAGLSQEQLARQTGFDETTIAKWERGDMLPLSTNLDRLRRFFQGAGLPLPGFGAELSFSSARRAEAARAGHQSRRSRA